jgi:leucyl/phenylalanyl-tRNA--protein transferase
MSDFSFNSQDLLNAYMNGYFPMAHPEDDNNIFWHKPEMRGIIPLDNYHIPKNLRRLYNKKPFILKMDSAFEAVMRACSEREETWISEEIISHYVQLHKLGFAHSFECWNKGELVGGLYGVSIGKAFFGESMFFRQTNASKIALIFLLEILTENDFLLLDTQYLNDHLKQFGGIEIESEKYMALLDIAIQ